MCIAEFRVSILTLTLDRDWLRGLPYKVLIKNLYSAIMMFLRRTTNRHMIPRWFKH